MAYCLTVPSLRLLLCVWEHSVYILSQLGSILFVHFLRKYWIRFKLYSKSASCMIHCHVRLWEAKSLIPQDLIPLKLSALWQQKSFLLALHFFKRASTFLLAMFDTNYLSLFFMIKHGKFCYRTHSMILKKQAQLKTYTNTSI